MTCSHVWGQVAGKQRVFHSLRAAIARIDRQAHRDGSNETFPNYACAVRAEIAT